MALTINLTGVEPAFAKNTAFNKNFGTSSGDILLLGSTSVASKVLVTDSNNKVKTSSTTETQLSYLDATSSIQTQLGTKEATANKDATGGYVGLTLFKINFKNVLNTFTSFFTNSNTAARTYTFPDKDGTVAMTSDITGTNSGTNTGDQDLSSLAPLASPTFTGTVTSPAIILSSETASTIASFDASKNIKSLPLATYPSLTELSYVKGVTSAIQTQFDNVGEWIQLGGTTLNPADATTYNFGLNVQLAPGTSTAGREFTFIRTGTVTRFIFTTFMAGNGTSETIAVSLRNITTATDNSIGNITMDAGANGTGVFNFTPSIAIANTTDRYTIKFVTPAWVTNPTGVYSNVRLFNKS